MTPTEILIALDFDEPQPLPIGLAPGSMEATVSGAIYAIEIAEDDPLWDLLAQCEGCGNAASVDGRCTPLSLAW